MFLLDSLVDWHPTLPREARWRRTGRGDISGVNKGISQLISPRIEICDLALGPERSQKVRIWYIQRAKVPQAS